MGESNAVGDSPHDTYPVRFAAEYPHRNHRLTTGLRIFTGRLFLPPLLMIVSARVPAMVIRLKAAVLWFANRLGLYEAVVEDRDPSTDEQQTVHLDVRYPDAHHELNPRLPVVTRLVAIPHCVVRFSSGSAH